MARPPKARAPLKLAALQLFVEHGVHATGIREIARHAGCSEAALYRNWANKEALVDALFREHLGEVTALIDGAIASESSVESKLRSAFQACYRLYDEQPLVFRFVLLVQHEVSKNLPADLRTPQDALVDLVRLAGAPGNPLLISAAMIGMFLQTATFVLYGRLPGPLANYAEPVASLALRLI